eukprot:NODE_5446_length_1769_cov_8.680268.p1 GENE.NODE_5446_length_1769_cov_8.680268~~NODE_5446_length_1769_cov_8.680268.p1  ORF type:complete len:434 (-),score=141.40 NODE_5446_length_1769_cov_8.680268:320-1621(-)
MDVGGKTFAHSHCVQRKINRITDAMNIFSAKDDNGEIPLVLIPAHRSMVLKSGWWMTIPTGCYCVVQRFGKGNGIANPGGAITPPWVRIAYVVNMQSCTYNAPIKGCPTSDNVRVSIDIVITFMIRDAIEFCYNIGAARFDELLSGAVDEGIRILVRSQSHKEVYSLRGGRADKLLKQLNDKFQGMGVVFSNCMITHVVLPTSLHDSLQHQTEIAKEMEKAKRKQEYEMKELRRKSEMELEELKRVLEQTIVAEHGRRKMAELEAEQKKVKADECTQVAMSEAEQTTRVKIIEANAASERQKIDLEKYNIDAIAKAKGDVEEARAKATVAYNTAVMNAEADMEKLKGDGRAIELDAGAEAEASRHLAHKRKHELEVLEKSVLQTFAQKASYNLIGESGDRTIDALISGNMFGGGAAANSSSGGVRQIAGGLFG